MQRKIFTVLSGVMLASALAFTPALADTGSGHGDRGHGYGTRSQTSHYLNHFIRHQKDLGLNDDQVTKLKAMSVEWDKTRIKGLADIELAERDVEALMHDDKSDLSAIESKMKDAKMKEVSLRMTALKTQRDARNLLTPEQREKDKAEHQKRMSERMGDHDKQEQSMPSEHPAERKG